MTPHLNCVSSRCDNYNPQPVLNFYKNKKKINGRDSWCKDCHLSSGREWRRDHKDRLNYRSREERKANPRSRRHIWLKHAYGITLGQFNFILESQKGSCAICPRLHTNDRPLFVDHDHKTGKVRGLLCTGCNTAIGMLKDNPEYCLKASRYLEDNVAENMGNKK
jgi:hypothetical protein